MRLTDLERGFLSAVEELSGVHALGGDEELLAHLELVGVSKVDHGQGGTPTGVVDYILKQTSIY